MENCECENKKLAAVHDAIKGCNANLNKALIILDKIECKEKVITNINFDIGPVTTRAVN